MKTPETKQKEEFALAFCPRPTETVSIEIPKDVLHSLKQVAADRDMSVQALLKSYIGQGARQTTSLMWAAQDGYLAMVRFLVAEGADIHLRDANGWTALMWAADGGHFEVAKFLVDHGADVNAQNNAGETALMRAEAGDYQETADFLRVARYIQLAMRHATFEILDDQTFYGEIVGFQGVYANAETLEQCREELQSVLEGWITLGLKMNHLLPEVDGVRLEGVPESV